MDVRIAGAEALGTFVLVVGGVGSAVLAGEAIGAYGVAFAFAFGLSLLVMAYTIGPVSGCHINPAVTLGMVLTGKTRAADAVWYVAGPLVGAVLGGLVIYLVANGLDGFDAHNNFGANGFDDHSPNGYSLAAVAIAEVVLTALLLLVVVGTTRNDAVAGFGPVAAGFTLTLIHLVSIPVSNTSVNPARSVGAAVFAGGDALAQLWAFILFPLIGGALGALAWRALIGEEQPAA